MKYFFVPFLFFVPSFVFADCPESLNYTFHNLSHTGFGQQTPTMYYQLQVNVTGEPAEYLFIGYVSGNFSSNGTSAIFDKIPKAEYDNDPFLRGFYRGYISGDLETELQSAYGQPGVNGTIDLTTFTGDDFLACEDPPVEPGVAASLTELKPWLDYACMWLGVIGIACSFMCAFNVWDLVLRARDNPRFWVVFFLLCFPSFASAQGTFCGDIQYYQSHTVNVFQSDQGFSSISLTVNWSNRPSMQGVVGGNGFYGSTFHGFFAISGIPWDVIQSDPELRAVFNAANSLQCRTDLGTPGTIIDIYSYPEIAINFCGCTFDTSHGGCPAYEPSGPDVPTYCGDGETEDESPDDPNCGCPGQDYTVCDAECPDADNDLCCDEVDPKPDDPACGCTREGPTGECAGDCPQCEKLLTDYAEDFRVLFAEYGVDLSPFLGRGASANGLVVFLPVPNSWVFSGISGWSYGSDESFMEAGPLKTTMHTTRIVFRSVCLLLCLYIFTRAIMRVFLY